MRSVPSTASPANPFTSPDTNDPNSRLYLPFNTFPYYTLAFARYLERTKAPVPLDLVIDDDADRHVLCMHASRVRPRKPSQCRRRVAA
eukprot:3548416-Rhodomonas_salina.2